MLAVIRWRGVGGEERGCKWRVVKRRGCSAKGRGKRKGAGEGAKKRGAGASAGRWCRQEGKGCWLKQGGLSAKRRGG